MTFKEIKQDNNKNINKMQTNRRIKGFWSLGLMAAMMLAVACTKPDDPQGGNNGGNNGSDGGNTTPTYISEGLYLGIVGFNDQLYIKDISILDNNSASSFKSFVTGLTMKDGTVLYHAVNEAVNKLTTNGVPKKLINVSIVTFTDGLDQGSYKLNDDYHSGPEYLSAVHEKILTKDVDGCSISAYTIGVRGSDVQDIPSFQNNLTKLASSSNNVFEVTDVDDANALFSQIAGNLYEETVTYNLKLKLPAQDPGDIIRFTFDDVSDASNSTRYIEGTYNVASDNHDQLVNVSYHGMQCLSGSSVTAQTSGIFDYFTFVNLTLPDGGQVPTDNIKQWKYAPAISKWQINSEFTPHENSDIVEEYRSAMIMLVLDCSGSLSNDFPKLKDAARNFINVLVNGN